jgi:tyrosine-protein phosphatase YwqE
MSFLSCLFHQKKNLLSTDIHSHLIPSIDDGAKNIERSIELILSLKKMNYTKLITTPHISDMFPNSSESILEGYNFLREELLRRKIDIEIKVAAEYYADEHFEFLLKERDILSFGNNRYLLFELSYFTEHNDLETLIYDIKLAGYTPVLAHPERYIYFHSSLEKYKKLKEMGVLFQINLPSVVNYYSSDITKIVKKLISNGLVDFIGTDTHHRGHIKALKSVFSSSSYSKIFKKNIILNDTIY